MARKNDMTSIAEVAAVMETENTLRGKSFCITGHLGKPRNEIEELIKNAGGRVEKSVSYGLDYLITNNDWNPNTVQGKSSKLKKAEKYKVNVITEKEFFDMMFTESSD